MENTARLYNCARCHCQVLICSHCDRGNIYCGKQCSGIARRTSLKRSGKRYQQTYQGRLKHAARQRRYRSKHKKVTHQGSTEPPSNDPLVTRSEVLKPVVTIENDGIHCHFCGRLCSPFLRLDYLHRVTPYKTAVRSIIHRSPQMGAQAP